MVLQTSLSQASLAIAGKGALQPFLQLDDVSGRGMCARDLLYKPPSMQCCIFCSWGGLIVCRLTTIRYEPSEYFIYSPRQCNWSQVPHVIDDSIYFSAVSLISQFFVAAENQAELPAHHQRKIKIKIRRAHGQGSRLISRGLRALCIMLGKSVVSSGGSFKNHKPCGGTCCTATDPSSLRSRRTRNPQTPARVRPPPLVLPRPRAAPACQTLLLGLALGCRSSPVPNFEDEQGRGRAPE